MSVKMTPFRTLLTTAVAAITLLSVQVAHAKSLFESRSDIIINLTPRDFVRNGLTRQLVRLETVFVNFHSSSCSHCISHAPKWIQFAEALKLSGALVGAIDCDEYRDICSAFAITGTPSVKVFQQGMLAEENLSEELNELLTVARKKYKLIAIDGNVSASKDSNDAASSKKAKEDEDAESQPPPPPETSHPSKVRLRKSKRKSASPTAEPTKAKEGQKEDERVALSGGERTNVEESIRRPLGTLAGPTFGTKASLTPKQRVLHDASLSLRYGLEKGVFLGRFELSQNEQDALFTWLDLLRRAFPTQAGRWQLDWLYKRLQIQVGSNVKNEQKKLLSSKEFDVILEGWAFARRFDESYEWRFCGKYETQSATKLEAGMGYTCGLWLLLHILTVSAARTPHLMKEVDVSLAIHGFVKNFFSCNECRDNFLKHNPEPFRDLKASDPFALALWLWREHNFVSNRLNHEDESAGIAHVRDMFPSEAACPTCHRSGASSSSASTGKENGVSAQFDEGVVVRYLDYAYSNFEDLEEIPFSTPALGNAGTDHATLALIMEVLGNHVRPILAGIVLCGAYVTMGKVRRRKLLAKWKQSKH